MSDRPERLDIQLRIARSRRYARDVGVVVGLSGAAGLLMLGTWFLGLHWWYIPGAVVMLPLSVWIARLDADATEELTRWFWRPPS